MNRTVLMISYWYPPTPGAGAQRAAGFADHLHEYGWSPMVVAAAGHGYHRPWVIKPVSRGWNEDNPSVVRVPDIRPADTVLTDYVGPARPSALRQWIRSFV